MYLTQDRHLSFKQMTFLICIIAAVQGWLFAARYNSVCNPSMEGLN